MFDEDFDTNKIETIERDGQVYLNVGKLSKKQVKKDINKLVSTIPSLKCLLNEPDFVILP